MPYRLDDNSMFKQKNTMWMKFALTNKAEMLGF